MKGLYMIINVLNTFIGTVDINLPWCAFYIYADLPHALLANKLKGQLLKC